MTNILVPGRHHLLTNFQWNYLYSIIQRGMKSEPDVNNQPLNLDDRVDNIIYAVTSANHSNTRRNPLPLHQRAMALQEYSIGLDRPFFVYDIDDVGDLDNFAKYTLRRIESRSDGRFSLTPENTAVLCSTPVLEMYEQLGFKILPCELKSRVNWEHLTPMPWDIVEKVARTHGDWTKNETFVKNTHPASQKLWRIYNLGNLVRVLLNDTLIGDDGDLTETRDYNSYVRQMDEIAEIKYDETSPHIRSGRIGDIGCAVGSWIKLAGANPKFRESDFYGIEVSRKLFDICEQRKGNGDFANPYVFFSKKNAVSGLVFPEGSMNTIHTSSLTHEIESYAGRKDLLQFINNRYRELTSGGVWINRDVVGPENKNETVYMKLKKDDGSNENIHAEFIDTKGLKTPFREDLKRHLDGLSTYARFQRFSKDFRKSENYTLNYSLEEISGEEYVKLRLEDACEFMSKKDYSDNWQSEMHETFAYWSFSDWKAALENEGFRVTRASKDYANPWIVDNRLKGKVELYKMNSDGRLTQIDYPVTNMLIVAEKI